MQTVDLLVTREGEQAYVERQGSVRVLRVPMHEADLRSQVQAFQRALKRQLDGADYDVVHCRDSWSGIPVLEAQERLGYAVVYDLTRSPLGESALDPELDAQYGRDEEACILAADIVLAPTPAAVDALRGRGRPERVLLSPPGVDVDRFDWEDAVISGPPKIVYAGSIDPGHGVRVLVRAMSSIVREIDARLVLAGPIVNAKFEASLREGIHELGLDDKVDLLGPVDHDQLPSLLATATVCVVPSASDLTPNPTVVYPTKILEYMACRRPIVAPRRETVQMVVDNGREALLFEPGDPIDLARKVLRLLGEPALRDRIAAAAYDRVRRDFTASSARRALRKAYDLIAERYAGQFTPPPGDDEPRKIEILSDDDFEATVFEEAPAPPPVVDTALTRIASGETLGDQLSALDAEGHTSSGLVDVAAPPADETMEREPVAPASREEGSWTGSSPELLPPPPPSPGNDDWIVTTVGQAVRASTSEPPEEVHDIPTGTHTRPNTGTPAEGLIPPPPPPPLQTSENAFVAGEIDVPPPPPDKTASREISASDPDTGSRTHTLRSSS